jgi:geranylgeranyl diphosphate synthase, type III
VYYLPGSQSYSSIDDIEDNSLLRRGFPVAHSIYGAPQTINCANYIYFCALQKVEQLNNPHVVKIFTGTQQRRLVDLDELINLHRGQGMELYWRDQFVCPTEEEYIDMVNNKTGGLLRLAVKLMQACSLNMCTTYDINGSIVLILATIFH